MLRQIKSFRLPRRLRFLRSTPVRYVFDALVLLSCATALNAWLNVRYPLPTSMGSNFLLAIEVPIAFAFVSLVRRIGLRLGWWFFLPVAILALLVRLFMAADNISHRYVYRDFRVPLDLHLVPEFFRLMYDTSNAGTLTTYATLFFSFLALSVAMIWLILWYVHKNSERPGFRYLVLGLVFLSAGAVATQEAGGPTLYTLELSQRVNQEIKGVLQLPAERKKILRAIADVRARLGKGTRLDKLQGNNVLFIFVESYGRTAFVQPKLHDLLQPRFEEMQRNLEAEGFHMASNFVTSPTYGGFSWFAHYTVDTGVKVISHLHSQLLDDQNPVALADFFREAGYLPITVAPGNSRAWPGMDDQFGFRNHYFSWEFGYRGPKYGWATMADQYVLYHLQRAEIEKAKQPLFLQYALISSHAPWNDVPRYVEDWSTLGNGEILFQAGRDRFDSSWEKPDQILDGYAASIAYEMRMIEGYLTNYVKDDTLVYFVGDHQPHQGVTGPNNLTWSVPAHVVSRNPDFVAPFLRRGYTPGMIPDPEQPMPHVGMERFMEEFLSDFSTEPLAVDPGIWPPAQKHMEEQQAKLR
jgi:hypothetical protein